MTRNVSGMISPLAALKGTLSTRLALFMARTKRLDEFKLQISIAAHPVETRSWSVAIFERAYLFRMLN
jgi:hypothetical protein